MRIIHEDRGRIVVNGTYVVLLLVYLVGDCVFGGSETGGGVRIGVALCDLYALCQCLSGSMR